MGTPARREPAALKGGAASNMSEGEESDMTSSVLEHDQTWIEWYCRLKENRFFVEVEEDYVRDAFNLTGLGEIVPHFNKALDYMLESERDSEESDISSTDGDANDLERVYEDSAATLYGLVHARFILTTQGIQLMSEKYDHKIYGTCPNTYCHGESVLPIGLYDQPRLQNTMVYCPKCREIYRPLNSRLASIDGAYFGTTFAPLFFMRNQQLQTSFDEIPTYYIPRVFGFKVSPECRNPKKEDNNSSKGNVRAIREDKE
eukprot:Gregarina_sp_Poly_1__4618@NODE_246_length_10752_cov_151_576135_g216_i0_p4_GENE_NODE_246_length_10752_cov_151_576135_g216_i0NODE_246_length_10752_cov_151_576135_g216_i0_p4_ORF_typecomplete_len259_score25_12CK_II_beta/PF01214_18/4_4e66GSu_C4xC_C2xCH/PF09698_10/0_17Cys_rich_KTR/PF14205_6/0_18Cys_rich_KTR/PF14205_6/1_3e04_NODE_246_length_10752_cov_151_576135_g216_i074468222